MARTIASTETRAIDVLTKLRMLSDGFQYKNLETNVKMTCPGCQGTGSQEQPLLDDNGQLSGSERVICLVCKGRTTVNKVERATIHVGSPKDDLLREDLGRHEEVGRLVVYGGFQGTVDRITEVCQNEGWKVIRVDGRGWMSDIGAYEPPELLDIFMHQKLKHPRVVFVGHPGAAGMGLTLTASPSIIFYSNTFNPIDRRQAEDRGYRIGMSEKGGIIIDYAHLPTDIRVSQNLLAKKELESITMNQIVESITDEIFTQGRGQADDTDSRNPVGRELQPQGPYYT